MAIFKSVLALALLIILSLAVKASPRECIETLMMNSSVDSSNFIVHSDEVELEFGNDFLAESIYTIRLLLEDEGCAPDDVNFGQGPLGRSDSECAEMMPGREHTRICYVETNLGYFFVTRDLLDTYNINFNRWD